MLYNLGKVRMIHARHTGVLLSDKRLLRVAQLKPVHVLFYYNVGCRRAV